jgi:hypothetical protein
MQWNFLKKSWLSPIHNAPRRRRQKAPPARPHSRLCLEQLETRTVPTTITGTSASIFYNDLPHNLTSAYASYRITNTDGVNYADVWATIGNFTAASGSPVVTLAPGAPGAIDLGPLANGQTKTAFFYLGSNADTNVTQTHTVSVFNGPPASGSLLASQDFSFTSVQSLIQANSNKVTSVVVSPSTPTVGGTFTITVNGSTGTIGSAEVLDFTPAAYSSWRADAFQLTGATISFSGGNTGTFTNTLAIPPGSIGSTANSNYVAVYTFQVVGPTATPAAVSPVAYISSGNNVKHTDTGNFATLPPVLPPMLASPTLSAAPTPATVTLGANPVTLNDTASLAGGVNPTGAITFTLIAPGGATVDTETVTVNGDGAYTTPNGFTLPSSGTVTGTYQWDVSYSGDTNNNAASDVNNANEQVTVSAAGGQTGGQNGGTANGQNGGAATGQNGGANGGQNGGAGSGSTGPTVPTSPSEPMVPVAPQLPPLASGIDSPAVGGLTGQPNAVGGGQLLSLPGAPLARDLAFLPQQGKAPSASVVNSLVLDALIDHLNSVGTARFSSPSGAVQVRDLAFLPRDFVLASARLTMADPGGSQPALAGPDGGDQQALADQGGTDQSESADVQGVVFGDRNRDGVWSEGEPSLSGVTVRLVKDTGSVVAVTQTGPKGEYLFERVPRGQYQVEAERCPEWAGAVSRAFTVHTGRVTTVDPLGQPPSAEPTEEGASPADKGAPSASEPAEPTAPKAAPAHQGAPSARETAAPVAPKAANAVWMLLGAVVPAFNKPKVRSSARARRSEF